MMVCFYFFLCREFTLAEIEHFVDPSDKSHPKFENVSSQTLRLFPSEHQIEGKPPLEITVGDAVNQVSGSLLPSKNAFFLLLFVDAWLFLRCNAL